MVLWPAAAKSGKQTTLQFKPTESKVKRNPWSDDSASEMEEEEEAGERPVVAPREKVERKTKSESHHLRPHQLIETLSVLAFWSYILLH